MKCRLVTSGTKPGPGTQFWQLNIEYIAQCAPGGMIAAHAMHATARRRR